ncbi:hypothetical protein LINPERPRIM_LOCUS15050 [Linum perenne]
MERKNLTLI